MPPAVESAPSEVPLVVALDGALVCTDLRHESALELLRRAPLALLALPPWRPAGRQRLRARLAQRAQLRPETLPWHPQLLARLRTEQARGRRLVLCSESGADPARAVAGHLGLFDDVIAVEGPAAGGAARKADLLVGRFGERGFDYAGHSASDLQAWAHARQALLVRTPPAVAAAARRESAVAQEWPTPAGGLRAALQALRPQQWLKNLLVFAPPAAAFRLDEPALLVPAILAFLAFGFCASAVYLFNDLMDLDSDRAHPRKRRRPLAAGLLSIPRALGLAAGLLAAAAALAGGLPPGFRWALAGYCALALAYTLVLKRHAFVDGLALGLLYTARVLAGGLAVGVPASPWLLAWSLCLFTSLALLKRCSELQALAALGHGSVQGRGYVAADLPRVTALGVAAAGAAVLLLALYVGSEIARHPAARPAGLGLLVPIQLYWLGRMWMQARRRRMPDDPVMFALRDGPSLLCALLFGLVLMAAR